MKAPLQTGSSGRVPAPPEKRFLINQAPMALRNQDVGQLRVVSEIFASAIEQSAAARALRESEQRKGAILGSALDGIVTIDADDRVVEFNPSAEAIFGYARDEVLGREMADLIIPPAYRDRHRAALARYAGGEGGSIIGKRLEISAVNAAGEEFPVELTVVDISAERRMFTAFIRDITEVKRTQMALHQALAEQSVILANATVGIALIRHGRFRQVNPTMRQMFGYDEAGFEGLSVEDLHPTPAEHYRFAREANPILEKGGTYETECRMRRADGSLMWCRLSGRTIDPEDSTLGSIWIVENIDERRHAEEERRLAATVLATATEGVMVTDAQARIKAVNPAFTDITGYEGSDVIGKTPTILGSDRHPPEFFEAMWRAITTEGHWEGEIWNRRKNGDVYPEWLTINAVRDNEGEIIEYAAVFSDITRRKADEERVWRRANFDALTGLPNRPLMLDRLAQAITASHRHNRRFAVLFLDLDGFKAVNDRLGHAAGDALLQEVARRLTETVRAADTVARLGGDEFVVLLREADSEAAVSALAEKILDTVRTPYILGKDEATVQASIGIATYPDHGATPAELLEAADAAMYKVKHGGKNDYRFAE